MERQRDLDTDLLKVCIGKFPAVKLSVRIDHKSIVAIEKGAG